MVERSRIETRSASSDLSTRWMPEMVISAGIELYLEESIAFQVITPEAAVRMAYSERGMTYDVVQWTTGNVGQRSVRAIVANPELRLVGC